MLHEAKQRGQFQLRILVNDISLLTPSGKLSRTHRMTALFLVYFTPSIDFNVSRWEREESTTVGPGTYSTIRRTATAIAKAGHSLPAGSAGDEL